MIRIVEDFLISDIQDILDNSEDMYDCWASLIDSGKSDDLMDYLIKVGMKYKDFYNKYSNHSKQKKVWKDTNGSIDKYFELHDLYISLPYCKIVYKALGRKSEVANADSTGEIQINTNSDYPLIKTVFDHEIAHQLSNGNKELQIYIIQNYGDVFGRCNIEKQKFDGVLSYSPEETFADAFSMYINYPSKLKSISNDLYIVIEHIYKSITNLKDIISKFYDALYSNPNFDKEEFYD